MRSLLVVLIVGLLAAVGTADVIEVPDEENDIETIQQAMDLAEAGDTLLIYAGVYDSVHFFPTPLGTRSAVCQLKDGVTMRGIDRDDVVIDHTDGDYGILCMDVGNDAQVRNLTVVGGVTVRDSEGIDGDGRDLRAGIICLENASPTVRNVTIEESSTGLLCRTNSAPVVENCVIARGGHHGVYIYQNGSTPVVLDHVTIVANFDYGVYLFGGSADVTNSSITHNHKSGVYSYLAAADVQHCNVYWNDYVSTDFLNYGGGLGDQTGLNGNISEEPFYCDYIGDVGYDYQVCFTSPNVGGGEGGSDIGAAGRRHGRQQRAREQTRDEKRGRIFGDGLALFVCDGVVGDCRASFRRVGSRSPEPSARAI
jgi:hypothetical protein